MSRRSSTSNRSGDGYYRVANSATWYAQYLSSCPLPLRYSVHALQLETISSCLITPADRHGRRRPFTTWMKRLTSLKGSSSDSGPNNTTQKRNNIPMTSKSKKSSLPKSSPYPLSGDQPAQPTGNGSLSFASPPSSHHSPTPSTQSFHTPSEGHALPAKSNKSTAPTLSTNGETAFSDAAQSKAGTSGTIARVDGGEGSTFSSPAPSVRSLATTLTTVQSAAPSTQVQSGGLNQGNTPQSGQPLHPPNHFSHQFPSSPPATAVPAHLAPHGHPTTYNTATANNLLTDDASILTLASSSKRRRRNSVDTNASMRALAPASMFGGSRESLPLSVLSGNVEPSGNSLTNAPGALHRPSLGNFANAERTSVYSSSGVAPALTNDRSSYYAGKANLGDGGSIRSGLLGHGRNDSMTGSIGGVANVGGTPLTSPNPANIIGRASRRSSAWGGEVPGEESDAEKSDDGKG